MSVSWLIKSYSKLKWNQYWRITYTWFWFYHIHQIMSRGNRWSRVHMKLLMLLHSKASLTSSWSADPFRMMISPYVTTLMFWFCSPMTSFQLFPETDMMATITLHHLIHVYQQVLLAEHKVLKYKHLENRQGQQEADTSQVYYPIYFLE